MDFTNLKKNEMNKRTEFFLNVIDKQSIEIVKICEHVYLGNFKSAIDKSTLIDYNIKSILNVSTFDYHIDVELLNMDYKHIPFYDSDNEYLINYIPTTIAYIIEQINNGHNVLIHCVQGISRSPSIIIAFLIIYYHFNLYEAYKFVHVRRPKIKPNRTFISSLNDLQSIFV